MNKRIVSVSTILIVLLLSTHLHARDLVIGLSPFHAEKTAAKDQVKTVIQFLIETVEPGEQVTIYDAYHVKTIGIFAVPNKPAYRHPKAKLGVNKRVLKNLLAFAKRSMKPNGDNRPSVVGAVRLPQFLAFLGENHAPQQDRDVLVLGSPLFDDPKDQEFSMAQAQIPGDGHLQLSRSQTPYGIKGHGNILRNFRIHLGFSDGWRRDDHHSFYVKRFWILWAQGQGGSLVTFTSDLPTLFGRVKAQAPAPKHEFEMKQSDAPKLEMILLRPASVKHQTSLYERPLSSAPVAPTGLEHLNNVEVGITWDHPTSDLDLYVQTKNSSKALSFLNRETAEGKYFKDFVNSPRATNGYETVAFFMPIDVTELVIGINYFGGHVPSSVIGTVRISLDGQTYAKDFEIHAQQGNHGEGQQETLAAKKPANAQWIIIDPLRVLGLLAKG